MAERIKMSAVESMLRQLQAVTNTPMGDAYVKGEDGHFKAVPDTLVLDGNISGYRVEQICNDGGGVTTSLGEYRYTKSELYYILVTAVRAIRLALGEDEFHKRMRRAYPDQKAA